MVRQPGHILSQSRSAGTQLVKIRQSFPEARSELDSSIVLFFCENPSRIEYPDVVCQHISSSSVFMISLRSFRRRQSLAELSFSVGQRHSCWLEPGRVCDCDDVGYDQSWSVSVVSARRGQAGGVQYSVRVKVLLSGSVQGRVAQGWIGKFLELV